MPAIFLIKGFAKDEGGTLVWEIDATTPGSVLVNGSDLTAMFGGN